MWIEDGHVGVRPERRAGRDVERHRMAMTFPHERASFVLADAIIIGDKRAAEKHGLTERTILNYRKRLEGDVKLSNLFQEKVKAAESEWAGQLGTAIRAGIDFLKSAAQTAKASDPDAIHAVAGAVKILTEVATVSKMLDARIAAQARPTGSPAQPMASPGQAIPADRVN